MAVKSIVGQYETRGKPVASPGRSAKPRFIAHPLLRSHEQAQLEDTSATIDGLPFSPRSPITTSHEDITDTIEASSRYPNDTLSRISHTGGSPYDNSERLGSQLTQGNSSCSHEMKVLPSSNDSGDSASRFTDRKTASLKVYDTPAVELQSLAFSTATQARQKLTVPDELLLGSHIPVAASTVFSRDAACLSLPDLDGYISSLPAPSLPTPARGSKGSSVTIFPPLDRLEASGKTLDDLEHNAQIPHWWQNRNKYLGSLVSLSLSITGSSAVASLYSLHGLIDTVQVFALILNTIDHRATDAESQWRKLILGTIPNVLAFNFATSIRVALILLIVFMSIAGVLLYYFHRAISLCCRLGVPEGLQQPSYMKNRWTLLLMSFLLTAIYLPLSTMAVHVIVWSDDLWVVPNPYINATSSPPILPPLGPPAEFRDPLDFCWTTTMDRNEINYAPGVMLIALICLGTLTIWFPFHLRRAIATVCPKVDKYTELGNPRGHDDKDREYQRLLDRDRNPLQFLYHDYRRGWATYEATYLFAKLIALLIVAVVDPNNCLFRTLPQQGVQVARQIILLATMVGFFLLQCFRAPFLDPVSNASEWTSRMNYVLTALIALLVALNVPGKSALSGVVTYIVYGVTYGLGFYFTIIDWSITQRLVKRLARRIDFSIDIFSPRVDLSQSSPHTKRRIWQEAISALFLTSPECGIPKTQPMEFALARDSEYPPYLLAFAGTPGERHVENLKILREVGHDGYNQGVSLVSGPDSERFRDLRETIQRKFVGPDCFWQNPAQPSVPGCTRFFGNAWFIPFPPTVVIRYDDGPMAVLSTISELELYVKQNSSHDIQRRREVRMALRALDGQIVYWPYEHIQPVGSRRPLFCCLPGRRFRAQTVYHYRAGIFRLKRHGLVPYEGLNLGSGFEVELTYAKNVVVGGSAIGLDDDYDLTTPLARFLALNEELIPGPLTLVEDVLERYRHGLLTECQRKAETLSYRFLALVYDRPREPKGLTESSIEYENDARVRKLMLGSEDVFKITYARFSAVSTSPLATWWYIFWDDLWRRNYDTIKGLQQHAPDFNPHYQTSIAYTPLPRAALESFLMQRGLLHKKPKWGDFFHAGFLNKMYLRMNDIVFHGTQRADIIHLGANNTTELDMEEIDRQTQARPSSLGTGNGTDEGDESIRPRPLYRWEGILQDPLRKNRTRWKPLLAKVGVWMGWTPRWRSGAPSMGLAFDVRMDHGQYVLLQDEAAHLDEKDSDD